MSNKTEHIRKIINQAEDLINNNGQYSGDEYNNKYSSLCQLAQQINPAIKKQLTISNTEYFYTNDDPKYDRGKITNYINDVIDSLKYSLSIDETNETISKLQNEIVKLKSELETKSISPITVNNNLSNSNSVNFTITFTNVMEKVNNSSDFSPSEQKEIIDKINELKAILEEDKSKNKKWDKAKGIITFLIDKGFDAGIALLPFLTGLTH